ncbi:ATP-dependent Clp protease proteolytic subunit [Pseudovibrio sp. Ad5]|uniref:head maturation protease, ClpP-related n=1 Tax=Pseudovibrio sp. Ad5 TaxID=989436 RepID=UPI0007AE817F|nr:head maturation protease, ClpP-related [Pseudovibrio sp. Ad5]KZK96331.1 ATP-dependent Clp protease proteolytic subunit [Pseudovibrio sp. Ad5]
MKLKEMMAKALRPKNGDGTGLIVRNLDEEGEVEVLVYDQIGSWGISSESFAQRIKSLDADIIHMRLDSPGGDVFQARAMKTTLEQIDARVIVHIDGVAASAASYLMLGGDEIVIAKGAMVMIHNAWSFTIGDAKEHEKSAHVLEKIDSSIRYDYAKKTSKSEDEFRTMMDEETWFDADEALEIGLVDRVFEKDGGANNRYDLSIYENTPAALLDQEGDEDWAANRVAQLRRLEFYERTGA